VNSSEAGSARTRPRLSASSVISTLTTRCEPRPCGAATRSARRWRSQVDDGLRRWSLSTACPATRAMQRQLPGRATRVDGLRHQQGALRRRGLQISEDAGRARRVAGGHCDGHGCCRGAIPGPSPALLPLGLQAAPAARVRTLLLAREGSCRLRGSRTIDPSHPTLSSVRPMAVPASVLPLTARLTGSRSRPRCSFRSPRWPAVFRCSCN